MAGLSILSARTASVLCRRWYHIACAIIALAVFPTTGHANDWFFHENQVAYKLYQEGQLQRSLAHWDHSSKGSFGRGVVLMRLGRMYDAEQAFRLCLHLMPQINIAGAIGGPVVHKGFLASIWYNLGNTLYAQHELKQAAAAWRKALDFEPEHAKARHNLNIVNRLLGRPTEDENNPLGLAGKNKLDRKDKQKGGGSGKGGKPKQQPEKQGGGAQHGHGKQVAKAGQRHGQGAGKEKQQGSHGKGSQAGKEHGKNNTGKTSGTPGEDINVLQTKNELRMVQEGVNIFMRHRLNAKHGHVESPYRGPAW